MDDLETRLAKFGLTKASEEEIKGALKEYPPNNLSHFVDGENNLFLGRRFSSFPNYFWYDTTSGKLIIDIRYSLNHTPGNTLGDTNYAFLSPKTEQQKMEYAGKVKTAAAKTLQHLEEILGLFDKGLINHDGETLFYSNKQIYEGLHKLTVKLKEVISSTEEGFGTEEFKAKVNDVLNYFDSFRHRYSIIPDKAEQEFIRAYRITHDPALLEGITRKYGEEFIRTAKEDYKDATLLLEKAARKHATEMAGLLIKTFVDNKTGN